MKLVLGKNPNENFHIYLDSGQEITKDLTVCSIVVEASTGYLTTVTLECEAWDVEAEVEKERIEVLVRED